MSTRFHGVLFVFLALLFPISSNAENKCPDLNASYTLSRETKIDGWIIPLKGLSEGRRIDRSDMRKTLDNLIVKDTSPRFTCGTGDNYKCYDHLTRKNYEKHPITGRNWVTCCNLVNGPYWSIHREKYYLHVLDSKGIPYMTSTGGTSVDKEVLSCRRRTLTTYSLGRMFVKTDNSRVYSENMPAPFLIMTRSVRDLSVRTYTDMPSF